MNHEPAHLTPEIVSAEVRGLLTEEYVAPDYLRLFQDIFAAQYQAEAGLNPEGVYPPVSPAEAAKRLGQGLPLIDSAGVILDEPALARLLESLAASLARYSRNKNASAERLLQTTGAGDFHLDDLLRAFLNADEAGFQALAGRVAVGVEELAFLAKTLLAPCLRVAARPLRHLVDLEHALTDRCPICGGLPLMGRLRAGDGKRFLECSLCATQWAFPRLCCPFCGNEDPATLGYLFPEGTPYRLDKCDRCRGYLKTVDERKIPAGKPRLLAVEDAATLYLDILAGQAGYRVTEATDAVS